MFCPQCGGSNPQNARFCMLCAARLGAHSGASKPVTGPTVRLDPARPQPARVPGVSRPAATPCYNGADLQRPLFFAGLALLLMTHWFWPGILVLLAAMGVLRHTGQGRSRDGLHGLIFFGGLALLFTTGFWWPGILLWLGALSLADAGHHKGRCWW